LRRNSNAAPWSSFVPAQIDHAAVEAAELGRGGIGDDLELLDRVDDREVRHRARLGLEDGDAVVEILVHPGAASVEAREGGAGGERHARHQGHQRQVAAAVQRKLDDAAIADHLAQAARLGLQERDVRGDRGRLGEGSDREGEVDADPLAGGEPHPLSRRRAEPGRLGHDAVGARPQVGHVEEALGPGRGLDRLAGRGLGHGHAAVGDGRPRLVPDLPGELGQAGLGHAGSRPGHGARRGDDEDERRPDSHRCLPGSGGIYVYFTS